MMYFCNCVVAQIRSLSRSWFPFALCFIFTLTLIKPSGLLLVALSARSSLQANHSTMEKSRALRHGVLKSLSFMPSSPLTLHTIDLPHLLLLPLLDLLLPVSPGPLLLLSSFLLLLIHLRDTLFLNLARCLLSYHDTPLLPSPLFSTAALICRHRNSRGFLRIHSLHGDYPPWQFTPGLIAESATFAMTSR